MIEERIEELREQLAKAREEYTESKKDVEIAKSTILNTDRDIETTEERMDELQKLIDLFQKRGKTDWNRIQKRIDELNTSHKGLNGRLTKYLRKLKLGEKKTEELRFEVNSCGVRINELEKLLKEM